MADRVTVDSAALDALLERLRSAEDQVNAEFCLTSEVPACEAEVQALIDALDRRSVGG